MTPTPSSRRVPHWCRDGLPLHTRGRRRLAALAPTLAEAMKTVRTKAFVILDGTLLPIDRIAADNPVLLREAQTPRHECPGTHRPIRAPVVGQRYPDVGAHLGRADGEPSAAGRDVAAGRHWGVRMDQRQILIHCVQGGQSVVPEVGPVMPLCSIVMRSSSRSRGGRGAAPSRAGGEHVPQQCGGHRQVFFPGGRRPRAA